jgi:dienelactone hydrolase
MRHEMLEIRTDDGICPAHVFEPQGKGRWPGVLFFMDGLGIRPALFEMGERMASGGYHVLLPDLYYRSGFQAPGMALFTDPVIRADWTARVLPTVSIANIMREAIEDPGFDDAQKQRLDEALTAAGVDRRVETYDARHGWVPSDTPVHDPAAAERHWQTLFELLRWDAPLRLRRCRTTSGRRPPRALSP